MDSRQLRYFAAIFEEGALARAADRERVAVSALSRHLSNLEAELGTPLFERLPRGVRPTASGARLYEHARAILRSMQAASADIRDNANEVAGEISVGFAHSAVKAIGVPLVQRVSQAYPKLRLHLSEIFSGSTAQQLASSEVDLTLTYNQSPDSRFRFQPILEEELVLVGRPDVMGGTDAISFEALLELPLIILRQGLNTRAVMDDPSLLRRIEENAQFQINSIAAIGGSLLSGIGCLIGTEFILKEHIDAGTLVTRPIVRPKLSRALYIGELSDRPATFALEAVRQLCIELTVEAVEARQWKATLSG
ncbi:MAG: LysR substrate-binding domain-containing protein [Roseibium album]|uniref:CysJI operon transcriptional activator n=2 Tax=cellular organisms TaxID=131567 RepID=A0A0M6ZA42_9HYPH|nr:LysR substrate-binding domain-containing protein [Roseibium album]MBG6144181.1 LysR family nitrogen assimilation transcriptional regulator [Labrenzia sp. EL_142]MBG6157340.1 LysR family nitrogen assimilation transcriptional regulator [Labrenzia sp. EL_162]MBG6196266.1 LysR family nitrogen assimilation transcriptional regulator [Labrenzia sp. EL_159]CTQ58253.1 CysJI operon transcriptional activator [Roseibium album]CTQ65978.1 CysJI operon transcriptional activator [Roseibium album]